MKLILMRHGEADSAAVDFNRELTDRGREDISRLGDLIEGCGWKIEKVYHSPLVRARQTGKLVADALDCNCDETPYLQPGADPETTIEGLHLHDFDQSRGAVVLVFHMPDVAHFISYFTSIPSSNVFVSPGSVYALNFNGKIRQGGGLLTFSIPPEFFKIKAVK